MGPFFCAENWGAHLYIYLARKWGRTARGTTASLILSSKTALVPDLNSAVITL